MLRVVPLLLIFPLALLPSLTLAAPPSMPPAPVLRSASAVTMTAFLDKSVYQLGQPIVLEVDLHNTGTQEAYIGMTADRQSQFHFLITEASGRIVPRTALGDQFFTPLMLAVANAPVKIKPNATYRARFNLTDLYGLLRTGRYSLTASRILVSSVYELIYHKSPALTADPLKFQIVSPAAPSKASATPFVHDPNADENIP